MDNRCTLVHRQQKVEQMGELCERLREERERLRMNQEDFGALGGVTKRTQAYYESGERTPDAKYLASVAGGGVDLVYVITGARSITQDEERLMHDRTGGDARLTQIQESGLRTIESYGPSQAASATVLRIESPSIPVVSREDVCSMIIDILHAKRRTLSSTTVWAIVDSIMALQRAGASVDKSTIDSQLRLVK